ncbi:hypothetical protein GDO86_011447 [Hymenochirus boettgeri]|uniref:G-protein coupled receptors family 1 profile domain-containing protein n=1 Tax=Hymenochirus boettgeri TaxID=247094 RepID=A0A8T2JGE0_9PIPI|nr:hypothetical protein GDO86_011447 [Hymenochirus boettgeri]
MNHTEADNFLTTDYNSYGFTPCQKNDIKLKASRFIVPMYIFVFLLGIIGNTLVILILLKYKKLRNMTDIFLLNLAISDLLFVFSLPFWIYYITNEWVFGDILCKLFSGVYLIGFYGASFFIILLTLDRYLAIVHAVFAIKARSFKFGVFTSLLLWGMSILVSLPGFIFYKVQKQDGLRTCSPHYKKKWKLFCTFMITILGLLFPLVIMIFCYSRIICTLLQCKSVKKHRAVKLIFIIMIVFLLFWMPYNIVYIIHSFQDSAFLNSCDSSKKLDEAIQWTEGISFLHCCLNPIIYAFVGEKFRKYLCIFLQKIFPCSAMLINYIQVRERNSSVYNGTSSTGEQDISAVL